MCEANKRSYAIETPDEGIVYLINAGIFFASEIFYVWKSFNILKNNREILKTPTLLCFYIFIHLIFVLDGLYFLGGVLICYDYYVYAFLGFGSDVLDRSIVIILIYRIDLYLEFTKAFNIKINWYQYAILVACFIDIVIYFTLSLLTVILDIFHKDLVEHYTGYADCVVMISFTCLDVKIFKCMRKNPSLFSKKHWYILMISIFFYCTISIAISINELYYISDKKNLEIAIMAAFQYIGGSVFPGLLLIWFISQTGNSSDDKKEALTE